MLDTHARRFVEPAIAAGARAFARAGFSADGVTWLAFALGLGAGGAVLAGTSAVAVLLLWLSGYLDAVDGSLARLTGRSSAWGTVLDVTFDRLVELSVILALGWLHPEERFVLLVLASSIVVGMTVFLTVGAVSEKKGVKSFYYQAGLGERTEGFVLLTAMILFQEHLRLVAIVFVGMMIFTLAQRLREARRILR